MIRVMRRIKCRFMINEGLENLSLQHYFNEDLKFRGKIN